MNHSFLPRPVCLLGLIFLLNLAPVVDGQNPQEAAPDPSVKWFEAAHAGELDTLKELVRSGAIDLDVQAENGQTALHEAARGNQAEVVRWLFEQGADPNLADTNGATLLYWLGRNADEDLTYWALANGAKITREGWHPLLGAAGGGSIPLMKFYLQEGLEIQLPDRSGWTAAHVAAGRDRLEALQWLEEQGANLSLLTDSDQTPLHIAAERGHVETVAWLVTQDEVDVDYRQQSHRFTAVHLAAQSGHLNVIRILAAAGADLNVRAAWDVTPLALAIINNHDEVVDWLLEEEVDLNLEGFHPLRAAARAETTAMLERFVNMGLDVNLGADQNRTAVHSAASRGRLENLQWLHEKGAKLHFEWDNKHLVNRWSPILDAIQSENVEVIQWLVQQGLLLGPEHLDHVLVNSTISPEVFAFCLDQFTEPPSEIAWLALLTRISSKDSLEHAQILLDHLGEERAQSVLEWTDSLGEEPDPALSETTHQPLANARSMEMLKILIEAGASPDHRVHPSYMPPLTGILDGIKYHHYFYLFSSNPVEMVEYLLAQGADPEVLTLRHDNPSPIHMAVLSDQREYFELLLQHGADINLSHPTHGTPLHYYWNRTRLMDSSVLALIERGVDPTLPDPVGQTLLHPALRDLNEELFNYALELDLPLSQTTLDQAQPVHYVLSNRDQNKERMSDEDVDQLRIRLLERLLDMGEEINVHARGGITPLYLAVWLNRPELVRYLLEHGAEVNPMVSEPPIVSTTEDSRYRDRQNNAFLRPLGGESLLHRWVRQFRGEPSLAIFELLREAGADPNAVDFYGRPVLSIALLMDGQDREQVVDLLLEAGARIDHQTEAGENPYTALLWSLDKPNAVDLVQGMGERGFDLAAADRFGRTLLHQAMALHDPALARFAIAQGVKTAAPVRYRFTPLHFVATNQSEYMGREPNPLPDEPYSFNYWIEEDGDPNALSDGGISPLMAAVISSIRSPGPSASMSDLVGELVAAGADPNMGAFRASAEETAVLFGAPLAPQRAFPGDTALHLVLRSADTIGIRSAREVVEILLEAGADPAATNDAGETPLDLLPALRQSLGYVSQLAPFESIQAMLTEATANHPGTGD